MPALRTRDTLPRPLELNTDALAPPQPPTLAIIAPTPRAFEFPSIHNLDDSPLNTPSCSPFEPERRPLISTSSLSSCPSPPRSLSPSCHSPSSPSPTSPLQKRRKAASCDGVERRPKKGDEDYIKRPENAFILFRRKCCEDRLQAQEDNAVIASSESTPKKPRQADLSRKISEQWKSLSSEDRQYWENLAKEKKKEHERLHPNYQYRPQRAKDKESKRRKGMRGEAKTTEHESISFVLPMPPPRSNGRSSSVPTPPPVQSFSAPNVYLSSSTCPNSPENGPQVVIRGPHPRHANHPDADFAMSFDWVNWKAGSVVDLTTHRYDANGNLVPISEINEHTKLMPTASELTQLVSPSSSNSSGTSSPRFEPFTPTTGSVQDEFVPMYGLDPQAMQCAPDFNVMLAAAPSQPTQAELDIQSQMELNVWGDQTYHEYMRDRFDPHWTEGWGNGFDLASIPPVEFDLPKITEYEELEGLEPATGTFDLFAPAMCQPQQQYGYEEVPMNFDEMISVQPFQM